MIFKVWFPKQHPHHLEFFVNTNPEPGPDLMNQKHSLETVEMYQSTNLNLTNREVPILFNCLEYLQILTIYLAIKELLKKTHCCFRVGVYISLLEQLVRRKTRCRSKKNLHKLGGHGTYEHSSST